MNNCLSFSQFYDDCQAYFPCQWLIPPSQSSSMFSDENVPLISYINPLKTPIISVTDFSEDYEFSLLSQSQVAVLANVSNFLCASLSSFKCSVPLLITSANTNDVIETLLPYLQKNLRRPAIQHGVMLDIFGKGVFLIGPSGIGKSEGALALLSRGHRLVSDDITYFYRAKSNQLVGYSPARLQNLLEIRGLGVIDVRQWHGPCSITKEKALDLVITLSQDQNKPSFRPIKKELGEKIILGVSVPHIALDLAFKRDLAMLIESAVQFAFSSSPAIIENLLTFPSMASTESHS